MKVAVFWVSAQGGEEATASLNTFLASHRVLGWDKAFCPGGPGQAPGWSVWVTHEVGPREPGRSRASGPKGQPDYRELLDEETFRIFSALRKWRKAAAAKASTELYLVASNEQLADVAQRRLATVEELRTVAGFGEGTVERFGESLALEMQRLKRNPDPPETASADVRRPGREGAERGAG